MKINLDATQFILKLSTITKQISTYEKFCLTINRVLINIEN